jgi:hypothetical protein
MAERSSLTQGVQLGLEATPGTPVPANKKFVSIGIEPAIQIEPYRFRPMGQKFASLVVPGKEWVEADISGVLSYSEIIWFLASVLKAPAAPTTLDTSARQWTFAPAASSEDTVKTYTVEQGGVVRAHKFSNGIVTELEVTINRDSCEVSGTMLGQALTDSITMTAAPTTPPEVPVLPTEFNVFLDGTSGGLGTTKLTRVLEVTITVGDRFSPVWVLNSAQSSYVAVVESEPTCEITLLMEADTEGMSQLTQARAGSTKFMRIEALSTALAGAATQKYRFAWDAAIKVKDVGDFSDEDGVYAIEWTFEQVYDAAWGNAMLATVVNKETAL